MPSVSRPHRGHWLLKSYRPAFVFRRSRFLIIGDCEWRMGRLPYQHGVGEYRRPTPDSHLKTFDIYLLSQFYREAAQVLRTDENSKMRTLLSPD